MTYSFGFVLALGIGVVLGLIGGGGSILSLPLLQYFFGVEFFIATSYSLFIVGISSMVGLIPRIANKEVAIREGLVFLGPSMFLVFLTRMYVIAAIPENFDLFGVHLTRDILLSIVFVALLLIMAIRMMFRKEHHIDVKASVGKVLFYGALTGFLAGLVGAGGGFIIVPILVSSGLTMKRAIGTSMFIISIQSLVALLGDAFNPEFAMEKIDFNLLIGLSVVTISGVFLGGYLQRFFKGTQLRRAFAFLLFIVGIAISTQMLVG